jgi:hypothetical protein
LRFLRHKFNVKADELRFGFIDLVASACGGLAGTGNLHTYVHT